MTSSDAYQGNILKYKIYVTIFGLTTLGPLCHLFYLSAGISFSQLSIIEIVSLIVLVLLEIPTGAMADLIGRKKSMSLGCVLMGCEYLLIGYGYNLPVFVLAALIGGIGMSLESGADESLLYDSLKKLNLEHEFQKILGQSNALFKISGALAGIIGGVLYDIDASMVFYIFGSMLIGLALYSLTMKETVKLLKVNKQKVAFPFKKQIKYLCLRSYCCLKANPKLMWMILFSGFLTTTIRAHTTLLRAPLLDEILANSFYLGLVVSLGLALSSIVSWYAHKLSSLITEKNMLVIFVIIASTAFIGIGYFDGIVLIIFTLFIYMLSTYMMVFFSDYWHRHFKSRQRGTLVSITEACQSFIGIFTLIGAGIITDTLGLKLSSIFIGVFIIVFSFIFVLKLSSNAHRSVHRHQKLQTTLS